MRLIQLAAASLLALQVCAHNATKFALYKNSHFHPCPSTRPPKATLPIPDKHTAHLPTNASLSPAAFCDRFWNYTVLPSEPTNGAYGITWINAFMNGVSSLTTLSSMIDVTSSGGGGSVGFIFLARGLTTTVLWWRSFIIIGRDYPSSHAMLSLSAVTTVWSYFITMEDDDFGLFRFLICVFSACQYIISLSALILYYKSQHVAQYTIPSSFNVTAYTNCTGSISSMLHDPTNTAALASITAAPMFLFWLAFPFVFCGSLGENRERAAAWNGIVAMISALLSFSYGLGVQITRAKSPIAWDPGCGLVHIMMSSKYGYWDIKGEGDWSDTTSLASRVVHDIFAIYF